MLAFALATSLSGTAGAFCKTTTCDAAKGNTCAADGQGCVTTGETVSWPRRCLSFAVQKDGSPKLGISYDTFDRIVRTAFEQWLAVDCGGGKHPSLSIWDMADSAGSAVCDTPEYNDDAPNANVWTLRDGSWPYTDAASTYAHTTQTYEGSTGHLLDADVEINSFGVDLTTSNDDIVADLQSIATHEAGHFLGLANSPVPDATMSGAYSPASRSARSLSEDDKAGICALYPPDRDVPACNDPTPNHGYSRYCGADVHRPGGCAVAAPSAKLPGAWVLPALGFAAMRVLRRRAGAGKPR